MNTTTSVNLVVSDDMTTPGTQYTIQIYFGQPLVNLLTPSPPFFYLFFFFKDTATPEISPLPLHAALPICAAASRALSSGGFPRATAAATRTNAAVWASSAEAVPSLILLVSLASSPILSLLQSSIYPQLDRKSTRLNSSHGYISYAVFCLKK